MLTYSKFQHTVYHWMHKRKCGTLTTLTIISQLFLLFLFLCNEGNSQTFVRSCQDPLIAPQHTIIFGHTYCYHSCGYDLFVPNPVGLEVCTANGICQCNFPCGTAEPINRYGDQCPPRRSDPNDTDTNAMPNCLRDCGALCTGGQGQICSEVYNQAIPGSVNTFAKICTCYCPPQACPTPPTTTTTTTPAPTTTATAVVIVKNPFPLFIVKKKVLKVFKLCVLVLKLCALTWIKLLLFCLYYYCFHEWISPVFRTFGW